MYIFYRFSVEQYNTAMIGKSHLFFIQVVCGAVVRPDAYYYWAGLWELGIKAKNCSEPGPPSLYHARLIEYGEGNFPSFLYIEKMSTDTCPTTT
jgi:hypothetical protein